MTKDNCRIGYPKSQAWILKMLPKIQKYKMVWIKLSFFLQATTSLTWIMFMLLAMILIKS